MLDTCNGWQLQQRNHIDHKWEKSSKTANFFERGYIKIAHTYWNAIGGAEPEAQIDKIFNTVRIIEETLNILVVYNAKWTRHKWIKYLCSKKHNGMDK